MKKKLWKNSFEQKSKQTTEIPTRKENRWDRKQF